MRIDPCCASMGVNHGNRGTSPPHNLERGGANALQIVPQILSCFKISSTRLLALQCSEMHWCSKSNIDKNCTVHYCIHLRSPPNHHFKRKIQHFFWRVHGQNYRSEFTKTPHSLERKITFFSGPCQASPRLTPRPPPHINQAFWICSCNLPEFRPDLRQCVHHNASSLLVQTTQLGLMEDGIILALSNIS